MIIVLLFSAATLVSALCMFTVEPLLAKMLLPLLGGAEIGRASCRERV